MKFNTLILPFAFAAILPAQTQLVRGDVDTVQGTNRFVLECTNIELVSGTVNLQQLHNQSRQQDIEYEMQVRDVSTGGNTILDVVSAQVIPEIFDMGNIRLGRSDTWEVLAAPGSPVWILVGVPELTSYLPLGSWGTWLLGFGGLPLAQGTTNAAGRFQIGIQPPNNPVLVGVTIAGQAVAQEGAGFMITNLDCKTVRSN